MLFGNITPALKRFYDAAHNNEGNERRLQDMAVQPLNANYVYLISQVLLRHERLNNYTQLHQRMTALSGPSGTGNTSKIIFLVTATY